MALSNRLHRCGTLALVALLMASQACSGERTQILVVSDSDLRVPDELDAVRFEIRGPDGGRKQADTDLADKGLPASLGLVHDGGPLGPYQVTVRGRSGGSDVVVRRALVSFVDGRTVILRMNLLRRCVGLECGGDDQTCGAEGCRPVEVSPGELEDWNGSFGGLDASVPDSCRLGTEKCNGRDDDCDGRIDEDFDLDADAENCGACGRECAFPNASGTCRDASCAIVACDRGWDDCDGRPENGCEQRVTTLANCGSCGAVCELDNAAETCSSTGGCEIDRCNDGWADCNGDDGDGCESTLAHPDHCGDCETVCEGSTPLCSSDRECTDACEPGEMECDRVCARTETDPLHCGDCGNVCPSGVHSVPVCNESACAIECDEGWHDCDGDPATGCESDLRELAHCGACGEGCALANAAESCAEGSCVVAECDEGFDDCNEDPSDGCEAELAVSETHCGTCGNECAEGEECVSGSCRARVEDLDAGEAHTCAVKSTGEVVCWGAGMQGQLGDGETMSRSMPVTVTDLDDAVDVGAGGAFSCAVRAGGEVSCWGANGDGQLGDGGTEPSPSPQPVVGVTDAVQVAAGAAFACARQADGTVWCWGDNSDGQLGDPSITDSSPVAVSEVTDLVDLAAGDAFACGVQEGGAVWCWGANDRGQLGAEGSPDAPAQVAGVSDATAVAAGAGHVCVRREGGQVSCWGAGGEGQLGNGSRSDSASPVFVEGLTDAVALGLGREHSCAVRSGGGVSCWGTNRANQLDGGTASAFSRTPVSISVVDDGVRVAGGETHHCASRASDEVYCWGAGTQGQLGDGSEDTSPTPVMVVGLP